MLQKEKLILELKERSKKFRREIIEMIYKAGSGHPGGSLSAIDLINTIYYYKFNINPKDPRWEDRDRFILSKGHCCPALYVVLTDKGFFPKEELSYFRKINHLLEGHSNSNIPGVEMSSGSLGQGLSFANGIAFSKRIDKKRFRIYVMIGDGEVQEGEIWESAMTSNHYKLDVKVILDKNGVQNDWYVKETKTIDPIEDKWNAFGWETIRINGHDFEQIISAIDNAEKINNKPVIIIADTVKGKGVSFMENNPDFHGKAPNEDEYKKAMEELK
ncbi:MAG: transketolase [Nanoarchaeota archaeon]